MSALPDLFAALGDATRFAIVERPLNEGELSAGDLQRGTGLSPPAVSRHLKVLRDVGLVDRKVARESASISPARVRSNGSVPGR